MKHPFEAYKLSDDEKKVSFGDFRLHFATLMPFFLCLPKCCGYMSVLM